MNRTGRVGGRQSAWLAHAGGVALLGWLLLAVVLEVRTPGTLGASPGEELVNRAGNAALLLLLATLLVRPVGTLAARLPAVIGARRPLGLWAAMLATVHIALAVLYVIGVDPAELRDAWLKRPYIGPGLVAWLLLLPLVATSSRAAQRWLGARWKRLHRLVYAIAVLAVVHACLQLRAEPQWLAGWSLALLVLLGWRVLHARRRGAG